MDMLFTTSIPSSRTFALPGVGAGAGAGAGAGTDTDAGLKQDWIRMLVQVHGLTQAKAETFARTSTGSCPKKLRQTLSSSSPVLVAAQSKAYKSQLSDMFGSRKETVLSSKVVQMFTNTRGGDTIDDGTGTGTGA